MMAELNSDRNPPFPEETGSTIYTPAGGLKKFLSNVKGEAEAKVIKATLQENHWRHKKTATELKISYKALLYKMRQYGLVAPPSEPMY